MLSPDNIGFTCQADAYETQVEQNATKSNKRCRVITSDVVTPDVPYGRSFLGRSHYALVAESETESHLRVRDFLAPTLPFWRVLSYF